MYFLPSTAIILQSVSFKLSRASLRAILGHTDTSNVIVRVHLRVRAIGEQAVRPIGRVRRRLARQRRRATVRDSRWEVGIVGRAPSEGEVLVAHHGEGLVAMEAGVDVVEYDAVGGQTGIAVGEPGEVEFAAGDAEVAKVHGLKSCCEGDHGRG